MTFRYTNVLEYIFLFYNYVLYLENNYLFVFMKYTDSQKKRMLKWGTLFLCEKEL